MDSTVRVQFLFGEYISDKDTIVDLNNNIVTALKNYKEKFPLENTSNLYIRTVYNIIYSLKNGTPIDQIKMDLSCLRLGWNTFTYDDVRPEVQEEDDFLENPFIVEEGALECVCGSKKVMSYQKQTRSLDEPSTTFAQCTRCRRKWIYNG